MIYKLYCTNYSGVPNAAITIKEDGSITSFIFNPANTDYQQFKQAINDDTAQLENADGVLMSQDDAKAFVATLP